MAYTKHIAGVPGSAIYAKPAPLSIAPWEADVIPAVEIGSTGTFTLAGLTPGIGYFIYEQLGPAPSPSDDMEGIISHIPSAIQVRTDLLGAGTVSVNAPVTATGSIKEIIIGDDYLAENGRAFEWLIYPVSGFGIDSCGCLFGGQTPDGHAWLIAGSLTEVGDKWKLSFDFPRSETAKLVRGEAEWSVSVHCGLVDITRVRNKDGHRVQLIERFTG